MCQFLEPCSSCQQPGWQLPSGMAFFGQEQQPSYPCRLQLGIFSLLPHNEDDVLRLILSLTRDRPIVHCVVELGEGKDPLEVFSTVLNNDRGHLQSLIRNFLRGANFCDFLRHVGEHEN